MQPEQGLSNRVGRTSPPPAARGLPPFRTVRRSGMRSELRLAPRRGRDDLLQCGDMAGEGAAAGGGSSHRGLRFLADEGLVDRDIAGLCKGLDMGAEIAIGGA